MTPAVTMVLSAMAGQERLSLALFTSVLLIAVGTGWVICTWAFTASSIQGWDSTKWAHTLLLSHQRP